MGANSRTTVAAERQILFLHQIDAMTNGQTHKFHHSRSSHKLHHSSPFIITAGTSLLAAAAEKRKIGDPDLPDLSNPIQKCRCQHIDLPKFTNPHSRSENQSGRLTSTSSCHLPLCRRNTQDLPTVLTSYLFDFFFSAVNTCRSNGQKIVSARATEILDSLMI